MFQNVFPNWFAFLTTSDGGFFDWLSNFPTFVWEIIKTVSIGFYEYVILAPVNAFNVMTEWGISTTNQITIVITFILLIVIIVIAFCNLGSGGNKLRGNRRTEVSNMDNDVLIDLLAQQKSKRGNKTLHARAATVAGMF